MALTPELKKALLAQTCCGDAKLCAALESEIDLIYECQDNNCNPRIKYIYTQLGLLEYAQIWARNQIDTTTRQMVHTTKENYSARASRDTNAENTATGRACNWAAATSQQNFVRDSTDDSVAFSESNGLRTAENKEDGFDRSSRRTVGSGSSMQHIIHTIEDRGGNGIAPGLGQEIRHASRNSSTSGGTGPLVPLSGTKWDAAFDISTEPPFISPSAPGPVPGVPFPSGGEICPDPDPLNPDDDKCSIIAAGFPSLGYGFSGRFAIKISFQLTVFKWEVEGSWVRAKSERSYFHCSNSSVQGVSTVHGRRDQASTARTVALPSENFSKSAETSSIIHLVRKVGVSTRRSTDTADAEERSAGYADGNAHSESERNAKGQAFQQKRSEALTTGDSESHLRRDDNLTDDEVRRAYGQIATQLAQLWQSVWKNLLILQRQFAAVPFGASMNCICEPLGCKCQFKRTDYGYIMPRSYY